MKLLNLRHTLKRQIVTMMDEECRAEAAVDFLAASEREFAAGDVAQGSEKLWGAASQAVIAVALQRGWRHGSHRDLKISVERLASEQNDSSIASGFAVAEKFHANFYHLFMEDYELERDPAVVKRFVNRVLALLN